MDLSALRTATRTRLGVPSTDAFFTDTVMTDIINEAIQFITASHDWSWLEAVETISCVNGTDTYTTATASQSSLVLYDAAGNPLERRPLDELVRIVGSTLTPHFFSYRGNSLVVRPTPSGSFALTHVYRGTETRLSSNGDTPAMPAQFHDAIACKAAAIAYKRQGQMTQAKVWDDQANEWVAAMKEEGYRYSDSQGGGEPAAETS